MRVQSILILAALSLSPACKKSTTPVMTMTDDGGTTTDAATVDAGTDRDRHNGLLLARCEDTEPAGSTDLAPVPSTLVGTVTPMYTRMSVPGTLNPATEAGETMYASMGYGDYVRGPGEELVLRNDLGGDSTSATDRRSLAWFTHLSDFQTVDDESPTRVAGLDSPAISGGLRSQDAYLTRMVSAMNRTMKDLTAGKRQFDFGVVTGDCSDNAQRNELQWMMGVMNGEHAIQVDSGEHNDPVPGPNNDPKDAFDATAFPAPWLYVPGNHDTLLIGFEVPTEMMQAAAIGHYAASGTRDYTMWWAPVHRGQVFPDPMREVIDREQIVTMLRADTVTSPGPVGHGYNTVPSDFSLGANYTYDIVPGVLRMVAIDTSDITGGQSGVITMNMMDNFIVPALEQAATDGVMVILATHHSTLAMDIYEGESSSTPIPGAIESAAIEARIAQYPQVIAWLVGHDHNNRIRAVPGADAEHPGYWEIMTSAIADYPSQGRTIEIVDNGNGTLSIFGVLVDWESHNCMERRARRLTQMEWISAWWNAVSLQPQDHNVELVIPVPPITAIQNNLMAQRTNFPTKIESQTTLRGL